MKNEKNVILWGNGDYTFEYSKSIGEFMLRREGNNDSVIFDINDVRMTMSEMENLKELNEFIHSSILDPESVDRHTVIKNTEDGININLGGFDVTFEYQELEDLFDAISRTVFNEYQVPAKIYNDGNNIVVINGDREHYIYKKSDFLSLLFMVRYYDDNVSHMMCHKFKISGVEHMVYYNKNNLTIRVKYVKGDFVYSVPYYDYLLSNSYVLADEDGNNVMYYSENEVDSVLLKGLDYPVIAKYIDNVLYSLSKDYIDYSGYEINMNVFGKIAENAIVNIYTYADTLKPGIVDLDIVNGDELIMLRFKIINRSFFVIYVNNKRVCEGIPLSKVIEYMINRKLIIDKK